MVNVNVLETLEEDAKEDQFRVILLAKGTWEQLRCHKVLNSENLFVLGAYIVQEKNIENIPFLIFP